jgi:energy-coupling factor transporter ATP-binding protein EcfA2
MINISSLTVRYPGASRDALKRIDLTIPTGAFVAIMGPNGSGKSTLALCLNGLVQPNGGSVTVDGVRTDQNAPRIRRTLGVVFQNPRLQITSLSVEREIAFGLQNLGAEPDDIHASVEEGLQLAGLSHVRHSHPSVLGGGELQRLALVSVLAMEPSHLVLDEATSLLSPPSRAALLDTVMTIRAHRGLTVVLITQFPTEALAADRLIMLDAGTVAFDGDPRTYFADQLPPAATQAIPQPPRAFPHDV